MSVAFTRGGCLLLVFLAVGTIAAVAAPGGAGAAAPMPTLPKSLKARQAQLEYDRTVLQAERALEKAKDDADAKRRKALQAAMDDALANKDLDDANKIKAIIGDKSAVGGEVPLAGIEWFRFGPGDRTDASIKLLPDGRLEGKHTGWTGWKKDGAAIVLLKGDKPSGRYAIRRDVPVLVGDSGKDWSILIPSPGDGQQQRR